MWYFVQCNSKSLNKPLQYEIEIKLYSWEKEIMSLHAPVGIVNRKILF